jgi:L-fuculose-phosphate aldolase
MARQNPKNTGQSVATAIVKICGRLHERNMLAAADGNVSFKRADGKILITPTGINKGFMSVRDMALIGQNGKVFSGKPSSEMQMHLAVYNACPKARAVVHAHTPHAIAWSIAEPNLRELPAESMSELILATGGIPIVPYARPTTAKMGENLHGYLPKNRVMILARHGALSWGETLIEAYNGMERLEHSAQILYLAKTLGAVTSLEQEEVAALREMRRTIGDKTL